LGVEESEKPARLRKTDVVTGERRFPLESKLVACREDVSGCRPAGRHPRSVRGRQEPQRGPFARTATPTAMLDYDRLKRDLFALGLLALVLFVGLSLLSYDPADPPSTLVFPRHTFPSNLCGEAGAVTAHYLRQWFGLGAYFLLFAAATLDLYLFSRAEFSHPFFRAFGLVLCAAGVCLGLQQVVPGLYRPHTFGSGGLVGAVGLAVLSRHFATAGTLLLCGSMLASGLLLTHDILFLGPLLRAVARTVRAVGRALSYVLLLRRRSAKEATSETALSRTALNREEHTTDDNETTTEESEERDFRTLKVNPPVASKSARERLMDQLDASSRAGEGLSHPLPTLDLLDEPEEFPYELLAKKARLAAMTLEKTFRDFGLNVKVVEVDTGPVITQFELELEAGLRLSKVTSLADDLAIALRVPSVRVVAPIPGKNTVGVEVPNDKQVMVRLRELIESCPEDVRKKRIPVFLGKDVRGRPLVIDLTKMPHLLIAGRTGTGKSVCLNAIILSVLMTRTPEEVRMLLIDPKMVELSPYKRVPHLMHPVITDMQKAEAVLAWAVDKMEERYDLLARCGVRHLDGYNKLGKAEVLRRLNIDPDDPEADRIPDRMPYILIIADEMADLMMTCGKDVEGHIIRLAQKSRAVGIHLVLATQKPTVDVITGLIKSNLPARISFQVASRSDSRVVLDEIGADKLLGNGDMLYLAPGTSNLTRAQGTFVSDDEISRIIEFYSDQEPQYSVELAQVTTAAGKEGKRHVNRQRDELYEQAVEIVIQEGRGSVSLLQRALGIGYGRAARLIDYMEEDGIVGEYNGSQAREVLYTLEQWEAMKSGQEEPEPEPAGL